MYNLSIKGFCALGESNPNPLKTCGFFSPLWEPLWRKCKQRRIVMHLTVILTKSFESRNLKLGSVIFSTRCLFETG